MTPNLRGLLLTQLGIVEMWTGDLDAAVEHLERAQAVAAGGDAEWTAFASSAHLALASLLRGDLARSLRAPPRRWTSPNAAAWRARSPRPPPTGARAISLQRDQPDEAERLVGQAGAALRDTRERPLIAVHVLDRVQLLSDRGEHVDALHLLRATREQLGDWPLPATIRELLTAQEGLLEAATGEPETGRALLQRGPLARSPSPTHWPGWICWTARRRRRA